MVWRANLNDLSSSIYSSCHQIRSPCGLENKAFSRVFSEWVRAADTGESNSPSSHAVLLLLLVLQLPTIVVIFEQSRVHSGPGHRRSIWRQLGSQASSHAANIFLAWKQGGKNKFVAVCVMNPWCSNSYSLPCVWNSNSGFVFSCFYLFFYSNW